jgi:ribosome-binding protein aMBF1 (putative translation factor)
MKRKTSNAVHILHQRYYKNDPGRSAELNEARINDDVARKIAALREERHLSQPDLAALVGTTALVIFQLEDADFEGHSLAMLQRIEQRLASEYR